MRYLTGFDDLFNNYFDDDFFTPTRNDVMKCDVRETADHYALSIALPGYKKEDIQMHLDHGYLYIEAKAHQENKEEKDGKIIRRERYTGDMKRSFYVGDALKESDIKASFDQGELNIIIPKNVKHEEEKKYIDIL
ncbi:Hsp20/alpha crystallin family protein [Intestinibaculum porci]|uniref:Hsp20/alpha crystallin family protein n=1 Tax=Intestinibaculum porci TaxID=2487118 RepID=UPI002409CBEB|nr:Hsp20/alpha crystallin family protein [Intestinibaculum porci]MDD6350211.1 Hsp20/alpha crystallin family protein [Intestinibaculum porci]MDD6422365.1 Hsp20/alpha crystallin family protein [Intestinibaculum porci]